MKKLTLVVLAAGLAVTAACSASTAKPLPQSGAVSTNSTSSLDNAKKDVGNILDQTTSAPTTVATSAPTPTTVATTKVSSCDAVREALLTGTQAQINTAMGQLQADKSADATAREYADYYLHRDKASPDMREMDIGLIRMSCSL